MEAGKRGRRRRHGGAPTVDSGGLVARFGWEGGGKRGGEGGLLIGADGVEIMALMARLKTLIVGRELPWGERDLGKTG